MFPCLRVRGDNEEETNEDTKPAESKEAPKVEDPFMQVCHNLDSLYRGDNEKIPKIKLKGFVEGETLEVLGPDEKLEHSSLGDNIFCKSISTYPLDLKKKARAEKQGTAFNGDRMGDPVCDSYGIQIYGNRLVMVLGDGCNWGPKPYEASRTACKYFLDYQKKRLSSMRTVREAAYYCLRGFAHAQKMILKAPVDRGQDIWATGTTTLLGAILLELSEDEAKKLRSPWAFVSANVGDCKAFHYSVKEKKLTDVTKRSSRPNASDLSDPGGRLGPYIGEQGAPDLRNLGIFLQECDTGDWIICLSDGVYDNLDPELLGLSPSDVNLNAESWAEADREEASQAKADYRSRLLSSEVLDVTENPTPEQITNRLLDYCKRVTKGGRRWMQEHPEMRMPSDRSEKFQGKMDHATCIVIRIGQLGKSDEGVEESSSATESSTEGHPKADSDTEAKSPNKKAKKKGKESKQK